LQKNDKYQTLEDWLINKGNKENKRDKGELLFAMGFTGALAGIEKLK
jgi:hypothetical protein